MSVVGPRPPIPFEFDLYDDRAKRRLAVKPGITGLYQITARSSVPFSAMLQIDLDYIERRSLGFDLSIMLRTPLVMLSGRGAG
jgi:lipopolysaccharide/colanic/teichoic acid biosynthesis glycosyltransferase